MTNSTPRYLVAMLAGLFATCVVVHADERSPKDAPGKEPIDVRALLEKGQAAGAMPRDMVVRLSACLGETDETAPADKAPKLLVETWEFTPNQVHRVVVKYKDGQPVYDRVESHPFDSRNFCKDLLDGKAIETRARKGKGPETAFVGTAYHRGSRVIEVVWQGKTVLCSWKQTARFCLSSRNPMPALSVLCMSG